MKNRTLQIILTLCFSVAALYFALRGVNFSDVARALRQVHLGWLLITLALLLMTLVMRAARWQVLLGRKVSWRDAFGLINIGYLVSGVVPARAGDPARAFAASLRGPVSAWAALSVVIVERVLDMVLILLMLLGTLPFVEGMQAYLASSQENGSLSYSLMVTVMGVAAVGMLAGFIAVAWAPRKVEAMARKILSQMHIPTPERWLKPLHSILDGLSVLRSPREGGAVILWSLGLWVMTLAYFFTAMLACRSFLPEGNFFLQSIVSVWASAFGMIFPATGGIGSFHAAVQIALEWGFDIPKDLGLTYAIVVHAIAYLSGIVLGAITLLVWGISFKSLVSNAQKVEKTPTSQE
ncbi:MAG TPA: lysylphosphatidylglycerol synthase transmembrane domain-containing protein [Anaerolineae bacterium]|nr:lysylphosphatidylglycerol synthase transmembrane domain-containing protein [Anaerolineae bacterium]